jgi:hypothetical protein
MGAFMSHNLQSIIEVLQEFGYQLRRRPDSALTPPLIIVVRQFGGREEQVNRGSAILLTSQNEAKSEVCFVTEQGIRLRGLERRYAEIARSASGTP